LCDIKKSRALYLRNKFKLKQTKILTDWRKLVKSEEINAVYVATPNYLHEEMVVASAKNKKHILVEKPMTISLKAGKRMVRAAKRNKVILMVEQSQRFDPVHMAAKKLIDSGVLGKINMVRGRIGHAGPEYWSEGKSDWFYDKNKSGGGAMVDIGVHILDLIRWLVNKEVVEVFADIKRLEKNVPVEDNGNVLLRFADGTIGGFECSWTTRPYEVNTFIYGQRGKLITSLGKSKPVVLSLVAAGGRRDPNCLLKEIVPKIPSGNAWANAMHYFVRCVRNKKKPFVDGVEGLETVKVLLATYRAARQKRWVKVR
jgi:predicted dehydrogenase